MAKESNSNVLKMLDNDTISNRRMKNVRLYS